MTFLSFLWVWHPHLLLPQFTWLSLFVHIFSFNFFFVLFFCFLFSIIFNTIIVNFCLGKLVLITAVILHPCYKTVFVILSLSFSGSLTFNQYCTNNTISLQTVATERQVFSTHPQHTFCVNKWIFWSFQSMVDFFKGASLSVSSQPDRKGAFHWTLT